jgi:hypothetical protein
VNSIDVVYRIIEPYNRRRNQENGLSQWIGEIKCHYSINDYQIGKNDSVQRRDHCYENTTPGAMCDIDEKERAREREKCLAYLPLSENAWRVCRSMCSFIYIYLNLYSTLSSARIKCRWFYAVCLARSRLGWKKERITFKLTFRFRVITI